MQRDNVRDVRILQGGLEALIELSSNLGAFYVGQTTQEMTKRYPLPCDAPDTLILYIVSEDMGRDEAFAILRVDELLKTKTAAAKRCKPLGNSKSEVIIHETTAVAGFVYVKCHPCNKPHLESSIQIAKESIIADQKRQAKLGNIEEDFSRKTKETMEALASQLNTLMSPTKSAPDFTGIFRAAGASMRAAFPEESVTTARTIGRQIDFKTASMTKLESLLDNDAAFLRSILKAVVLE